MNKIIIIEDDSDLREMYKIVFESANYAVDDAADGDSEVLLRDTKYDAILLDLMFPVQEGVNIIRNIRSEGSLNKNTPIIIITNLNQGEKTIKALEEGADLCLLKVDNTPREVFKKVNELVESSN